MFILVIENSKSTLDYVKGLLFAYTDFGECLAGIL